MSWSPPLLHLHASCSPTLATCAPHVSYPVACPREVRRTNCALLPELLKWMACFATFVILQVPAASICFVNARLVFFALAPSGCPTRSTHCNTRRLRLCRFHQVTASAPPRVCGASSNYCENSGILRCPAQLLGTSPVPTASVTPIGGCCFIALGTFAIVLGIMCRLRALRLPCRCRGRLLWVRSPTPFPNVTLVDYAGSHIVRRPVALSILCAFRSIVLRPTRDRVVAWRSVLHKCPLAAPVTTVDIEHACLARRSWPRAVV